MSDRLVFERHEGGYVTFAVEWGESSSMGGDIEGGPEGVVQHGRDGAHHFLEGWLEDGRLHLVPAPETQE